MIGQVPARDPHRPHVLVVEAAVAARKRFTCGVLAANAWITRTPLMPSWSEVSVSPIQSRMRRYDAVGVARNLTVATITSGTGIRQTSSSCQDTTARKTTATTSSTVFDSMSRRPCCTRSSIESMSAVMRDTITPAFSRS